MSLVFIHADGGVVFVTDGSGAVSLASGVPVDDFSVLQATLAPSLVSDSDTFSAPTLSATISLTAALVTDADGFFTHVIAALAPPQSLTPALVADADTFQSPAITQVTALQAALVTDADTISVATVTNVPLLSPALFAVDDAFFTAVVTTGSRALSPALVTDAETFLSLFVTLVGLPGGPLQKLKPPPKIQDIETIFAFTSSRMSGLVVDNDIVRVPVVTALANVLPGLVTDSDTVVTSTDIGYSNRLRPALVVNDDASYGALISMVLQPALKLDGDGILATDVGWKVFAELTTDVDHVFSADAYAFYPLYPELWADEETIDTYPFFVQQLSGGIPVTPREGVLKGSIKRPPQLIGSITTKRAA